MNAQEVLLALIQRARRDMANFVSLLVFLLAAALFFRSWEFALITTASLGFHELGHAAALSWLGLEWRIQFGLVGAWTWSDAEERARLSQIANIFVHITGPFFSLALAVLALALNVLAFPNDHHLLILANFSAQVGFLNLLPLGQVTDGGKIVRRIVTSVDGKHRLRAILLPLIVAALMLALYAWAQLPVVHADTSRNFAVGLQLIAIWMASSMLLEARSAERSMQASPAAGAFIPATGRPESGPAIQHAAGAASMTVRQVFLITLLLWDMLAVFLIVMTRTPFWLEPTYVEGSLKNVMDVLQWLIKLI